MDVVSLQLLIGCWPQEGGAEPRLEGVNNRAAAEEPPSIHFRPKGETIMGKHLNPLEKELLIRRFKGNPRIKVYDFCVANDVSEAAFRKWMKQYEAEGIEGLARNDAEFKDVLPDGTDKSMEGYKREIMKLRIENERLKKSYAVQVNADGEREYVRLKPKSSQ